MAIFISLGFSFLVSLALTSWLRRKLLELAILDRPNARSSHQMAVPRGAGWAVIGALVPGLVWNISCAPGGHAYAWLLAGLGLSALISWQDDRKGVPAGLRLAVHLLAAVIGTFFWPREQLLFGGALPFAFDRAITALGWALYMNFYNFMDGIDGITGAETVSLAAGAGICLTLAGLNLPGLEVLIALLIGASLGFLALNWHPAKIFLGDVGSVPLGFLTGFCLLALAMQGQWAAAAILPMYYLADSGLTILRRAARGDKIWQAHREHFYQRAAARWKRHDKVVFVILLANAGFISLAAVSAGVASLPAKLGLVVAAIALASLTLRRLCAGQRAASPPEKGSLR